MKVLLRANIPKHIFKAAKYIIEKYHEKEEMLFPNNKRKQYQGLPMERSSSSVS